MGLKVNILTPTKKVFEGEVDILNVPTPNGYLGILPHHYPLLSMISIGRLYYRKKKDLVEYAISGGVLTVEKDVVYILAEAIERKDEIDVIRAAQAKKRAEERLSHKDEKLDVARAEAALARALTRLEVAEKDIEPSLEEMDK